MEQKKSLHDKIVDEILPRFAKSLKNEGVISDFNRKTFKVKGVRLLKEHTFSIKPDLLLILPDGKKFLVEIVNPRDPKRLMGEMVCVQLLGYQKLIDASVIFILPLGPEHPSAPNKGTRLSLVGTISNFPSQIIPSQIPSMTISWSTREDFSYSNLKNFIKMRKPHWWLGRK
jgi:hypothetical protein